RTRRRVSRLHGSKQQRNDQTSGDGRHGRELHLEAHGEPRACRGQARDAEHQRPAAIARLVRDSSARQTSIADHGRVSLLLVGPRRGDHRAYGRLIFRGVGISLLMEPLDGASIKDPSKANKHWSVLIIPRIIVVVCAPGRLSACGERSEAPPETQAQASQAAASTALPFNVTEIAKFNEPWAMTFLPDGRLLVTEKKGALKLYTIGGAIEDISGVPEVAYQGQGGLGDVVLHPDFEENGWVYLSYAEAGDGDTRGAAVARAKLELDENGGGRLADLQVIW